MENPWVAWYPGDYINKTRSLTMAQHGAYCLLLWEYYINGPFLAKATPLLNVCQSRTDADAADVCVVLEKFFVEKDGFYHHLRADEEIERRLKIREQRREYGKKGGLAKASHLLEHKLKQKATQSQSHIYSTNKGHSSTNSLLEAPPENLHPLNYARALLERLEFPVIGDNMRVVAAAIECEVRAGKSESAAYEFVLAGTLDAQSEGYEINRFFFADQKYRIERRSGNGRPTTSASKQRSDRSKRNIIDAFTKKSSDPDSPDGTER